MLVLSRMRDEEVVFDLRELVRLVRAGQVDEDVSLITMQVVDIRGDKVRLGLRAPDCVPIHRREVFNAIERERAAAARARGCAGSSATAPSPTRSARGSA